jgi:exosortase
VETGLRNRFVCLLSWFLLLGLIFWRPLASLIRTSLDAGYSSHIVLIPFISLYLIWSERQRIFEKVEFGAKPAAVIGSFGFALGLIAFLSPALLGTYASLFLVLSALLMVVCGYVAMFGLDCLSRTFFPVLLLVLVLPVPGFVVAKIITFLQAGSAWLSMSLFSLLGVPVLRNGFFLTVPGITIEVAQQCSGINSTIALFILMLLFAHQTLQTNSRRIFLVLLIIPFSILKNAIRIVTLTLLATKVDPGFLTGRLHHEGGFVFFLITLALVYPIWLYLRESERRKTIVDPVLATASAASRT